MSILGCQEKLPGPTKEDEDEILSGWKTGGGEGRRGGVGWRRVGGVGVEGGGEAREDLRSTKA